MNLLTNGVEAIKGSGNVIVSTSNTIDPPDQPGNIVISIQDTGTGISNEDIEHVFEPFYSKKAMGRSGTGLGLTVVWNSMADHDGKVTVENNEFGTCFRLFFPLTDIELSFSPENETLDVVTGQGESILVVDDEPHIRVTTGQLLEEVGYTVKAVESGEMALDYLKNHRTDLVLLDMLMDPGINGLQTYTEIIKFNPGQKAIIASGFSESDNIQSALQLGVGRFIKKPYSLELLSRAIREVLDEK
jgi:CheY-like chemotaxis protein